MRLTPHDEAVAAYDRILRLIATLDIVLNRAQLVTLQGWLESEACRPTEDHIGAALDMCAKMIQVFIDESEV